MGRWWIAALAALTMVGEGSLAAAAPVRTTAGLVEGVTEDGLSVYRGLPFAQPPVGDLRWRAPVAPAPWQGVRQAGRFAPACMGNGPGSSEDCLYLNVWSPAKPGERLPVMVWIYGGGFTNGATSLPVYSGEVLAKKGVVLVSIAYRLGVLGFLAHPALTAENARHVSGNYGLLDQIEALKWVQANIAAFGGDPAKVTIFGESAGGMAVSMLATSPLAKGLFRGAMSESGGSFGAPRDPPLPGENMVTLKSAEQAGLTLGAKVGATTAAQLRALPADTLTTAGGGGPPGLVPQGLGMWPVFDGYVLPGDQYALYQAGRFNETPVLIGINSDEGVSFSPPSTLKGYQHQVRGRYGPFADRILAAYPAADDATAKQAARDLARDAAFGWHNWVWARLQSGRGKAPVYYYYFEHKPPYPAGSRMADAKGVPHGAEVPYVFGHVTPPVTPAATDIAWRPQDQALSDRVTAYWSNFVKTADPNAPGLPRWPAFTPAAPMVMHLNTAPAAGPVPNPQQLQVLDAYFAWRRGEAAAGR